jgi:hypothetical protein
MKFNTNFNLIPRYSLSLSQITYPSEILRFFARNRITGQYVYSFSATGILMKYGMSDNSSIAGERVYRQAGHIPLGWTVTPASSSGADMRILCDQFLAEYGIPVHKNNVILEVYDLTNYPRKWVGDNEDMLICEGELIEQYEIIHKGRPIGNIKPGRIEPRTSEADVYNSIFDKV